MRIIKLDAIDSTNTFLKQLSSTEKVEDYTVVMCDFQTQGRGQMGTVWNSNKGENLMFSVLKDVSLLTFEHHFYISMVTALAMVKTLEKFSIPKLSIKWPNDILSANKKICGVLIENIVKQNQFKSSIIGCGLNVNQTDFDNLPQASSLHLISGKLYDINEVLSVFCENLKDYFSILESGKLKEIKEMYESYLFRKDKPSTFKDEEGRMFLGFIKSVSKNGNLQVLLEDDILKEYDLKEVTLLY